MPELLLEIFGEEIPARMQARAAADLGRMLTERLEAAGLKAESMRTLVGPRRLTAVVEGLPAASPHVRDERKGPRVDAPKPAIEGFLRGAGLKSLDQCEVRSDKKGDFYVAVIDKPGRATPDIVAEAVPDLMRAFPWPKSMRLGTGDLGLGTRGAHSPEPNFRWVRPLHRVLCVYDGEIVPFEVGGVRSGDQTEGHRLLGRGPFRAHNYKEYAAALEGEGHVALDSSARAASILKEAKRLCAAEGLELVEDQGLLDEVAGLAEHPVVLLGDMDPSFLDLPPEVIRLTMRTHQKYFAVRRAGFSPPPSTGEQRRAEARPTELAPKFVVVANQSAPDGGKAIAAGNARVLSARLNDARYFWDHDRKRPLADMAKGLSGVVFHQKLGSLGFKAARVAALACDLCPLVGADPKLAEEAAWLAKADLVSEMVGEFPELQGVMGRYYAREQGALPQVADAIRDHYKPQGPSDSIPIAPASVAVALADKFDTLVSFWAIDEKPTGSKDPYALRRAALGIIRILLENQVRLELSELLIPHLKGAMGYVGHREELRAVSEIFSGKYGQEIRGLSRLFKEAKAKIEKDHDVDAIVNGFIDLYGFLADRLKIYLRDEGHRHDLVDAVYATGGYDLVLIVKRVEALGRFLDVEDGTQLLAAYRRAANILRDEEKKDAVRYDGDPQEALLTEPEERKLHAALTAARPKVEAALGREDFEAAMGALAPLRPAIDAFFDAVMVNAPDKAVRKNRLLLLSRFRAALSGVADFSKIGG
jgi:glycyl-tRNA synthetase beta chain